MNISEYKRSNNEYKCYYGRASMKKGYIAADGDEAFYAMVGNNSCYTMLELLHPGDVNDFLEAETRLGEGIQYLVVRMRCFDNEYHCLYIEMKRNGRVLDNFVSFDIDFCEFMELKDRYVFYAHTIRKYREYLSLSSLSFFEYTVETDELKVYRYVNVRSIPILKDKLENIYQNLMQSQERDDVKAEFQKFYDSVKSGKDKFDVEVTTPVKAGEENDGQDVSRRIKGKMMYKDGSIEQIVGTISLVGGVEKARSYYMTDNAFDAGTGLLNKRAIHEYAVEQIRTCEVKKQSLYLAMVDVDDFKKVNDNYGHMFGDEVLSKVSELVRSVMGTRGVAGRFGGDEFMVVFDHVSSEQELRRIAKTIAKHISWAFLEVEESLAITTSWGIAKYPDDGADFDSLFKKADKALYIAKAKGKNRYIIYDEKKHGNIVSDKEVLQNSGIRTKIASDSRKAEVVQEITLTLHKEGKSALQSSMQMLCSYFDIDGAAVYVGDDMQRIMSVGKYVNPISNLTCIHDPAYLELFDRHGIYEENKISRLDSSYVEAYKLYMNQENGKFIQCLAMRDGKPVAVVAFDFFNRSPKLGATDFGMIHVVGALMAQIAAE